MKTLIALFALVFSLSGAAQTLEAKSIFELITELKNAGLVYKETGKIFGFNSIQSCLFVSQDVAVFKNYCFPVRKYPARGYTIISKKFGMIDLYEERVTDEILKRDIQITEFPEVLAPYLTTPFPEQTLTGLSTLIEKLHYKYNPACWSTNFSWYTETNDVACNVSPENVVGSKEWAAETQEILLDEKSWLELMATVEVTLE